MKSEIKLHPDALYVLGSETRAYLDSFVDVIEKLRRYDVLLCAHFPDRIKSEHITDAYFALRLIVEEMTV